MIKLKNIDKYKGIAKSLFYSTTLTLTTICLTYAHLDDQIEKATEVVLGPFASLIVGGATLIGGGIFAVQGKVIPAASVLGVGAMTGIGIALAKSKVIFNLLQ